ncbi:unnamed protein product [Prunus armeniaca]|uniref:Uncharacterized protein n=1 Tax=Prunus armeniaca TaxID=36596 RepID=A0A6J5VBB8_PRUAR|nr:unnamed protein product [Prunus armeniaca]
MGLRRTLKSYGQSDLATFMLWAIISSMLTLFVIIANCLDTCSIPSLRTDRENVWVVVESLGTDRAERENVTLGTDTARENEFLSMP